MGAHFRFVHCADLHLGARFRGITKDDGARGEEMRQSVFDSFSRIIDMAVSEGADALVISGDAFDEETINPRTRYFLVRELERFGGPVYMVKGNHDPVTSWESSIPFTENVHVFGTEPESLAVPGVEGVEVIGASFADWHEERNLPSMMRGDPSLFTIACVHCDVDASGSEYQYSPCSSDDLIGKGVDYWALGHIHRRAVLNESPYVVYPGNIQGRSFKETGEKGAYLVTVEDGRVSELRFVPTQGLVWYDDTVDITGSESLDDVVDQLRGAYIPGSVVRLTFTGSGALDGMLRSEPDDIRSIIASNIGCTVVSAEVCTSPYIDMDARAGERDMIGITILQGKGLESADRDTIIGILSSNPVMKRYIDLFEDMDDAMLRSLVREATRDVVSHLGVSG